MTIWSPTLPAGRPLYRALAESIAVDIEAGVLVPAQRLPTQREMARRLGIALTTVTRGYAEAERRGLISSEVGRGTFVRRPLGEPPEESVGAAADLRGNSLLPWPLLGDLRRDLAAAVGSGAPADALGYANAGLPRHRAAGSRLAAAVGVSAAPERMLVTAGAQHAMAVVFASLLETGDTLLAEELTYAGLKSLAHLLRLRLRPVAMDRHGIIPEALREACAEGGAKALYCIPVLQNPTAAVMTPERCRAIAEVAEETGIAVVEDDSYGFLLPQAPRLAALLPNVFWLTGTSKGLLPSLRIGFLRAPPAPAAMLGRLEAAIEATIYLASPLAADAVARWVDDGTVERVQQWKRDEVAARQQMAIDLLRGLSYTAHPASPHGWLTLPEPWTASEAVAAAAARGIEITPSEVFALRRDAPHAVRLCVGPPRSRAILENALAILAATLREPPGPGRVMA